MLRVFGTSMVLGCGLVAVSCSSGPQAPQPGTPAYLWSAAKTTYAAGDFLKAKDNLTQLAKSDNEFTARSQPWAIVLTAGIAQAYADLADNFDIGAKVNRANPMSFRRHATVFRKESAAAAMECADLVNQFLAAPKIDPLSLDFSYPSGNAAEPVAIQRIGKGLLFPDAEVEALRKSMVQHAVLLISVRVVGAGDNVARALDIFQKGGVKVERPVFLLPIAKALYQQSDLFTATKLDYPEKVNLFCDQAEKLLKDVPESKETQDLEAKIAKSRKATAKKT